MAKRWWMNEATTDGSGMLDAEMTSRWAAARSLELENGASGGGWVESAAGGNLRGTVVKRFTDISTAELPADLALALDLEPACRGSLDKLASSAWVQWQSRFWELRGFFMVYYNDKHAEGDNLGPPLGAIDLRKLTAVAITRGHRQQELVLSSRKRDFRLRQGSCELPALDGWLACIERARERDMRDERSAAAGRAKASGGDLAPSEGDAEIIMTDVYDDSSSMIAMHRVQNPITVSSNNRTSASGRKPPSSSGIEPIIQTAEDPGLGDWAPDEAARLPLNLRRALVIAGIQQGSFTGAVYYMWSFRSWLIFTYITLFLLDPLTYAFPDEMPRSGSTEAAIYYQLVNVTGYSFKCKSSLVYEVGENPPCLLMLSLVSTWPVNSVCALIVFTWLLKHSGVASDLVRTHRARMAPSVDHFAQVLLGL